ncbi:MAG: hypothetical protein CMF12_12120 [Idiomarina sp.]|uniref:hypothetical protein n=1 Tax=Idiomarina sp. TaxID=1874361 RepID=UPI000C457A91|nr:hypothetical protein [Idiomarina sp.]MBT43260.1 hypothetical protein [Idiomarina sp.]
MNKTQQKAAARLRDYCILRKLENGAQKPYLKRVFGVPSEHIDRCENLEASKPPRFTGDFLFHPIDHDILFDMWREASGLREREKGDMTLLDPGFDQETLTIAIRWNNDDVDEFCYRFVQFIAERLDDQNDTSDYYTECLETIESDFFAACCKVSGLDYERYVEALRFKLKQCGKKNQLTQH